MTFTHSFSIPSLTLLGAALTFVMIHGWICDRYRVRFRVELAGMVVVQLATIAFFYWLRDLLAR